MSASAILKLQKVGFTTEQVEALADFMDTQAASKADLTRETATLRTDISAARADLRDEISKLRTDTAKWIVGAVLVNAVTVLGGMLGLAKLLGH